jgi:hypothetical protein
MNEKKKESMNIYIYDFALSDSHTLVNYLYDIYIDIKFDFFVVPENKKEYHQPNSR